MIDAETVIERAQANRTATVNFSDPFVREFSRFPDSIEGLSQVVHVKANRRAITDLGALARMTWLTGLELAGARITDATPLEALTELRYLDLSETRVRSLAPLSRLTALEVLILDRVPVSPDDLEIIGGLRNLYHLDLKGCRLNRIDPLSALTGLETLSLSSNGIHDVTPLKTLTRLRALDLSRTSVADIRPLLGLRRLVEEPAGNGLDLSFCAMTKASDRLAAICREGDPATRARNLFNYLSTRY